MKAKLSNQDESVYRFMLPDCVMSTSWMQTWHVVAHFSLYFIVLICSFKSLKFEVCEAQNISFQPSFHSYWNWSFYPSRLVCVLSAEDGDSVGVLVLTLSAIAKYSWSGGHRNCTGGSAGWWPRGPTGCSLPHHHHCSRPLLTPSCRRAVSYSVHGPALVLNYVSETKPPSSNTEEGKGL